MHTDAYVFSRPNKKWYIYTQTDMEPKDDYGGALPGGALQSSRSGFKVLLFYDT